MDQWNRWYVTASFVAVGLVGAGLANAESDSRDHDGRHGRHGGSLWTSAGQNLKNTRYQSKETKINVGNVSNLTVKWSFSTDSDVSATPAVDGTKVYVPDWAGNLYAVDRVTGRQVWKANISVATGVPDDKARATPVISGNKVILGTQGAFGGGGKMLAFDKDTGDLLWNTTLDSHPAATVTQSAVAHRNRVYVGLSSREERFAAFIPDYPCCSFRGSMLALDVNTGAIVWKTDMVPTGYSGGAIWGSTPAIDTRRSQIYIATGNNYSVPDAVLACVAAAGNPRAQRACIAKNNYVDTILALDLKTGVVRWAKVALPPYDAWNVSCLPFVGDGTNCPEPAGPDYDFGQGPALFTVKPAGNGKHGKPRDLVGAGQKSGKYWAVDPDTGAVQWVTSAGPGGQVGGLQWGSAVDGKRVYTANANSDNKPWTMPDGSVVTNGIWSGLDAVTGDILWQTAPPHGGSSPGPVNAGSTSGPVTTANGVVFGCSLDPNGYMYALNAATGAVLWEFPSGGSCLSGAAISNGTVFWGSGYSNSEYGTPNNKLYAFDVP